MPTLTITNPTYAYGSSISWNTNAGYVYLDASGRRGLMRFAGLSTLLDEIASGSGQTIEITSATLTASLQLPLVSSWELEARIVTNTYPDPALPASYTELGMLTTGNPSSASSTGTNDLALDVAAILSAALVTASAHDGDALLIAVDLPEGLNSPGYIQGELSVTWNVLEIEHPSATVDSITCTATVSETTASPVPGGTVGSMTVSATVADVSASPVPSATVANATVAATVSETTAAPVPSASTASITCTATISETSAAPVPSAVCEPITVNLTIGTFRTKVRWRTAKPTNITLTATGASK